jgi:hypothetical protein
VLKVVSALTPLRATNVIIHRDAKSKALPSLTSSSIAGDLEGPVVVAVEEAEADRGGVLGVEREVDARRGGRGAQGGRAPGGQALRESERIKDIERRVRRRCG